MHTDTLETCAATDDDASHDMPKFDSVFFTAAGPILLLGTLCLGSGFYLVAQAKTDSILVGSALTLIAQWLIFGEANNAEKLKREELKCRQKTRNAGTGSVEKYPAFILGETQVHN